MRLVLNFGSLNSLHIHEPVGITFITPTGDRGRLNSRLPGIALPAERANCLPKMPIHDLRQSSPIPFNGPAPVLRRVRSLTLLDRLRRCRNPRTP